MIKLSEQNIYFHDNKLKVRALRFDGCGLAVGSFGNAFQRSDRGRSDLEAETPSHSAAYCNSTYGDFANATTSATVHDLEPT